jgi:sodium/bile acid cotransporter 7
VEWIPPRVVVACILFLMAWGLRTRELLHTLTHPAPALLAVTVSYGVLPLLGWLAGPLLPLPDFRLGLLVCASVPCTLASAVLWTRLGGGNEATALLAVVLSTSLGWLATPLWLTRASGLPVAPDTAKMMSNLFLVLVVPLVLAQVTRAIPKVGPVVDAHKTTIGVVARLMIFSVILLAVVTSAGAVTPDLGWLTLGYTAGVCVGLHLTALTLGLSGARLLGFARVDAIAVAFTSSQKTLPVSLFLFYEYYKTDYPLAVIPMVFYHVGQLIADTFVADRLAAKAEPLRNEVDGVSDA